jgi:methylsterol monooxygenase
MLLTLAIHWILGGLFLLMDVTLKPEFLRKYKIQPGANEPVDRSKLVKVIFFYNIVNKV